MRDRPEEWTAVVGVLHDHTMADDESGLELHAPMTLAGKTVRMARALRRRRARCRDRA